MLAESHFNGVPGMDMEMDLSGDPRIAGPEDACHAGPSIQDSFRSALATLLTALETVMEDESIRGGSGALGSSLYGGFGHADSPSPLGCVPAPSASAAAPLTSAMVKRKSKTALPQQQHHQHHRLHSAPADVMTMAVGGRATIENPQHMFESSFFASHQDGVTMKTGGGSSIRNNAFVTSTSAPGTPTSKNSASNTERPPSSKRKRDASTLPLPDAKSQRLSSILSNKLARTLKVEDGEDSIMAARGEDTGSQNMNSTSHTHLQHRHVRHPNKGRSRLHHPPQISIPQSSSFGDSLDYDTNSGSGSSTPMISPLSSTSSLLSLADNEPSTIAGWMEKQARKRNLTLDAYMQIWGEKRKELEYNLSILSAGVGGDSDSYEDIKMITQRILAASEWLSGGCTEELGELIPLWKNVERDLEYLVSYIKVIEDLKSVYNFRINQQDPEYLLSHLRNILETKKSSWGDILKTNGHSFRSVGLPVDQGLLNSVKGWVYGLVATLGEAMVMRANEVEVGDQDESGFGMGFEQISMNLLAPKAGLGHFLDQISSTLQFLVDCLDLVHGLSTSKPVDSVHGSFPVPSRVIELSLHLATVYIDHSMDTVEAGIMQGAASGGASGKARRIPEAKLIQCTEGVIKVLNYLKIVRVAQLKDGHMDFSPNLMDSLTSSLISFGLTLFENISTKSKVAIKGISGHFCILLGVAWRFIVRVWELGSGQSWGGASVGLRGGLDEEIRMKKLADHLPPELVHM